jgi:hypothetical protein
MIIPTRCTCEDILEIALSPKTSNSMFQLTGVATGSLSLSFITVCTGVRFMRKLNDEKVVSSEKGRSCPLHKRRTKEGHAVGRRREENHEDDITLHASHAFAVFRRRQRLARRLSLQSLIGYSA